MSNINTNLRFSVVRPQMYGTFWHCENCNSFITIHSEKILDQALCPNCTDVLLELVESATTPWGQPFADA
jgi:hypothetical protein